mmetsp:Transcript_670/g.1165  ORF Transcript_670/g.1165 Transcript_670/m.1165 type:complete len:560 (+) Transcript_670:39-1718(+)
MQKVTTFLACLACAGHIRPLLASDARLRRSPVAVRRSSEVYDTARTEDNFGKLAALAVLVTALNSEPTSRSSVSQIRSKSSYSDQLSASSAKSHSLAQVSQTPYTPESTPPAPAEQPVPPAAGQQLPPELLNLLPMAMQHIKTKNAPALRALLERNGASVLCMLTDAEGRTLLHMAAASGDVEVTRVVIDTYRAQELATGQPVVDIAAGPELHRDQYGVCPAEYAFAAGSQQVFDFLVDTACARPLQVKRGKVGDGNGREYLERRLKYEGDVLLDAHDHGVMMGWEKPLMKAHAEAIVPEPGRGQRVMNIGFGLGLVDGFLEDRRPGHHVIVEAHPDVQAEMARRGWTRRADVTVLYGRWQEVADQMVANGPYDGIFFDTWAEVGEDLIHLFRLMPKLLAPGGRFSWFNGLPDSSMFANAVQYRLQQMELATQGLSVHYHALEFGDVGTDEWDKVSNKYWSGATYYLPMAIKVADVDDSPDDDPNAAIATANRGVRAFKRLEPMGKDSGARVDAIQIGDDIGKVMKGKLLQAWWSDMEKGQEMLGLGPDRTPQQAFSTK